MNKWLRSYFVYLLFATLLHVNWSIMTLSLLRNSCTWAYLLPSPSVGVRVSFVDVGPIISHNCCLRTCIWGGGDQQEVTWLYSTSCDTKTGVSMSEGVLALVISMRFDTLLCDAAVSTQLVSDKVGAHSTCVKDAAKTEPGTLSRNKVFMKVNTSVFNSNNLTNNFLLTLQH